MSEIGTAIETVTVYPDQARVTRRGSTSLSPGTHRVEISELPERMDPASVRASARGTSRARLLGVDVRRDFFVETPAEDVRELETQIERVEDEGLSLDAKKRILEQEQTVLGELAGQTKAYARGLALGKMKAETHTELLDRFRSRAEELSSALLDLVVQRRNMNRRLERLRNEREQLAGAGGRQRHTAVIDIEVHQEGEFSVGLEYVIAGAGWDSLYDIRMLEEGERTTLEVSYLAQVRQRTGEDWKDVALTLSTARPALTKTIPELRPWYVGPVHTMPAPRPQAPRMMATLAAVPAPTPGIAPDDETGAEMVADAVYEAEETLAKVESSGTAVTYQIPGTVDVPTDGSPRKVAVARFELNPRLDYVSAPKLVEAVYRRAEMENDSAYTLLPGPASLFAGDEFLGTTKLDLTAPKGEIELFLGTDDRIRVERELKRRDVDRRFIGDRRRAHYTYEITVENLASVPSRVTLHDQLPVSRHEDVKVRLELDEPRPDEQTELNLLEWHLALGPTEKRVVRFGFVVECPRAMKLTGLA